ncbi:hypothetical protein Glove_9g165 [Diversispora epigaea]|uniref:BTB domain-containing protein n=1 Tax=Diversispora epigaea TaxID=1348612 RepID=A0A397JQ96_9GLOM|nr:hypothetical protein Glove_9g165 [Diversispora epigaea]
MALKFFDKLSQNFTELLNDKDDFNVIIEVEDKKNFTAHSSVLRCRSPYFRKELDTITPNEKSVKKIIKPNISSQIFDIILKYIYGGIVNLENVEARIIFDLMLAANKFELEELSKKLETILIKDKASWLKTHFSLVYHSIFLHNNFKELEKFCNDIVAKYPNLIFDAEDFTSLQESALVSLLKRDDIQMEEGKIWEYTIKWGISQNPTFPTNLEEWNKENFLTLKITLQQCLPYIRYFHISGNDFLDKVKPYKKILDKQIWEDLMQQLISPDRPIKSVILPARSVLIQELPVRVKESFSTIISDEHAAEISSWIDRKTTAYPSTDYPYEFQLILRGSKDGFSPQTFWNICHGHTGTVVIIKVNGTDEILGGYNPLMWDNTTSGVYKETNDSFIFSLKNGNIQNSILSRVASLRYALYYYGKDNQNSGGLNFGGGSLRMYSSVSNFTVNNESYYNHSDLMQQLISPDRPIKSVILPARSVLIQELPVRVKESFSTIISDEHAAEISSWIDRKTTAYPSTDYPYEFQLILRGSKDGFSPQTFWNICHGHTGTVVIIKVNGTDEILGGYNPLMWDNTTSGVYKETNDSFIFSLKNGNIQNSILSRVASLRYALYYYGKDNQNSGGLNFGGGSLRMYSSVSNFTVNNESYYNHSGHYEKKIRTTNSFSIVDYEVFKVNKKAT